MRRPGSVHKTGGFRLLETSGELDFTYAGERQVSLRSTLAGIASSDRLTDRPGPRAHLVGVYIELQNYIEFSSAAQHCRKGVPVRSGSTTPLLPVLRSAAADTTDLVAGIDVMTSNGKKTQIILNVPTEDTQLIPSCRDFY
ncbi:hypothetical protein AVEN_230619-1 [Araneus ventricosus]|uniref:Uncharacterized protein n=1 Tax=Araneus ventricosus TaxID=182803 RepID=A0A4Y2A2H8_ARAVE|nr:hypothetical protein AVEN_230619-1 [Araneus ventricosus]